MEITCFEAVCNNCGKVFDNPLLSDFSYGEFIARGDNGIDFAYLNAINEPAFDEIQNIFNEIFSGSKENLISCFHYVVGKCADLFIGRNLRIGVGPICPNCNSSKVTYDNIKRVGVMSIPKLTFKSFLSLCQIEKQRLINEQIRSYKKV